MDLFDLGLPRELIDYQKNNHLSEFSLGRVTQEHKEKYVVSDGNNEYLAEITGNLRYSANSRADFPAVGDWVALTIYDSDKAIINRVLPRSTILERQAVGKHGEIQIISVNIDVAFIVQAINNNFNINRLERYLTVCYSAGIEPVLVLSKTDLATGDSISEALKELEKRDKKIKHILLSNITGDGLDQIMNFIQKGRTYCVIGSSGVGKSTLINNLLKKNVLKTGEISLSTNKGKHVTEHRELFVLENGGIIIDTPGMKEIGVTGDTGGIRTTYDEIFELSKKCRFSDCKHIDEAGCAVTRAVEKGELDKHSYENFLKIRKEQERFQATEAEKRRKDKIFGKILKDYLKNKEKNGL